jgi:hypothetical protein
MLRIPTTFTPKYLGDPSKFINTGASLQGASDQQQSTLEENIESLVEVADQKFVVAKNLGYNYNLEITLQSEYHITRLVSSQHRVKTEFTNDNRSAVVTLAHPENFYPDRDFVFYYRTDGIGKPIVVL